jgi:high-affinity K+ transport system ATPase subunit B
VVEFNVGVVKEPPEAKIAPAVEYHFATAGDVQVAVNVAILPELIVGLLSPVGLAGRPTVTVTGTRLLAQAGEADSQAT